MANRAFEYCSRTMADALPLRRMTSEDFDAAMTVARSLPEWFNDLGLEQIADALPIQDGAVVEADGDVAGWVTWCSRDGIGEIAWIAVRSEYHRKGIGTRLVEFAEDRLLSDGLTEVQVETLGDSVDYEPYERTRAFYRARGFLDFKRVMTDNPGMPESLTLRKALSPRSEN
jgi:ribosomal protein S18 acetylase RimI-like enzyme